MGYWDLSLSLVSTIRHDGDGGVADDLDTVAGLSDWLAVAPDLGAEPPAATEELRQRVTELRAAIRSLFARAVRPLEPSRADAKNLIDVETALARLNAAAAGLGPPTLQWPPGGAPRLIYPITATNAEGRLLAALAEAATGFLAGPDVTRLRACPAPRCVRYFLQGDPRQAWCKPSCGNRARVARHYQRHRSD
ncbi:CGNR zinc finger domain-containing protein [Dactylosporangium fulvum]|uniref:CGNR zinc finger domain-containing protein n=1 Tax=Dactylosporangium fulvum TaxID=53359 RepID=A0ABY5VVK6_9ACTN|nr:CGNR zinc finger domain-containing protein [Dactylosporangium fulvum]UWP80518.1 CGNR zinc finger domain-containing protein [Dactylosporangium fulvum]